MSDKKPEKTFCPACHQTSKRLYGEKNGFDIYICGDCNTLYSPEKESGEVFDYENYYNETNLAIPEFVIARLKQIV